MAFHLPPRPPICLRLRREEYFNTFYGIVSNDSILLPSVLAYLLQMMVNFDISSVSLFMMMGEGT